MSRWQSASDYDKSWATGGGEDVPEGVYQVQVMDLDLDTHPRWQDEQLRWDLEIVAPDRQGAKMVKWSGLDSQFIGFVRKDLSTLGIQLGKFSELEHRRQDLVGAIIEIKVTYKEGQKGGRFQQVWINRLVKDRARPAQQQPAPVATTQQAPVPAPMKEQPHAVAAAPIVIDDPDNLPF